MVAACICLYVRALTLENHFSFSYTLPAILAGQVKDYSEIQFSSYLGLLQRHKMSRIKAINRMPPATAPAMMNVFFLLAFLVPASASTFSVD